MKEIKDLKELKDKVEFNELPHEVMKDIVFQLYIFKTQFDNVEDFSNKVVLLDENEIYNFPNIACEIEEEISGYIKQVYITSDIGDGIVIYKKIKP